MDNSTSYIQISPEECLNYSFEYSLGLFQKLIGKENFKKALNLQIKSPVNDKCTSEWFKTSKIIGINPRLTKTFWGIVKYAMTCPENAVHIMPLWDTGDGSLYVQNSWELNNEFWDKDLSNLGFGTSSQQLLFVVNALHALGKVVGFDSLMHVDNFSEITILNPSLFEWMKLNEDKTSQDFDFDTYMCSQEIESLIIKKNNLPSNFFDLDDENKSKFIFKDNTPRFDRRMELRKLIRDNGFEPLPLIEHAPMRPVVFEKMEYSNDDNWAVFSVKNKSDLAKIIGSNTPYKFYNVENGFPAKNKFDKKVVDYFISNTLKFQQKYGFDFLRADMGHNQFAHSHNEPRKDLICPEVWALLKDAIQLKTPYFATFAESFWGDYYISGLQDMLNKKFDSVLGNLNFTYLNVKFVANIKKFAQYSKQYQIYPCLTIFTNDADLVCHKELYCSQEANICRFFISSFFNLPSYMGIGYETKCLNPTDEREYSNIYVKKQKTNFLFGNNYKQFEAISNIRKLYTQYKSIIDSENINLLEVGDKKLAWFYSLNNNKKLFFAVNLDPESSTIETKLVDWKYAKLLYKSSDYDELLENIIKKQEPFFIDNIYIGECVIYELE